MKPISNKLLQDFLKKSMDYVIEISDKEEVKVFTDKINALQI